jgi:hypothetical protein
MNAGGADRALGIDLGGVPGDDAFPFQLTETLENGGRRETYCPGDFGLREARVFLKEADDLDIDRIEHGDVHSP